MSGGRIPAGPGAPALVMATVNWGSSLALFRETRDLMPALLVQARTPANARDAGWTRADVRGLERLGPRQFLARYVFPPGWCGALSGPAGFLFARRVRRDLGSLGLRPHLLGIAEPLPPHAGLVRRLRPEKLLYYCVDDYREYWPGRAARTERIENDLVARADLVVCVSRFLCDELARRVPAAAGRIVHIPNGVPPEFLASHPLLEPDELPPDLEDLPRPVLGYLGSIGGRIDWDILEAVAHRFPAATLLLIGPDPAPRSEDARRLEALCRCANVRAVGPRPHREIMPYIRAFDVCLIPEPLRPLNVAGCPQKLWAYCAGTRPVVSTPVPEQAAWAPTISIGAGPDAFCAHIARLLACGGRDGLAAERLRIAREHAWPRLGERLAAALRERGLAGDPAGRDS